MRKGWMLSGVGVVAAIGVTAVIWAGHAERGQAAAAVGMQSSNGKPGTKPAVTLEFTRREVTRPVSVTMPLVIEFSGPLVAPSTAVVRAKAAGTLLSLAVGEGSRVHAGQALGRIDLAELSSRVAERNAMLESAKAQLAQAERAYASDQRLAAQQFISPNALETSRSGLETAQAQVRAAQAQADAVRVGLRDAALVAPISGVVAKRFVVPGEKLSLEQEVFSIVDLRTLELAGTVGTHQVSSLSPGMPVQVEVEGRAQPVEGVLARIAPAAEAGTRSIGVTVSVANPQERFRAGQYALARVVVPDATERLTVPITAIGSISGQDHVWVIDGGMLARRAVTLGRRDERSGNVEVLRGLDPHAEVLSVRFDNLREGSLAKVVATPPAVASAASGPAQAALR